MFVYIGSKFGHWIALGIFSNRIEVFDPLGFDIFNLPAVPCALLKFLHEKSADKRLVFSRKIQPNDSILCGFYCLVYVFRRQHQTFKAIQELFSKPSKNDKILDILF